MHRNTQRNVRLALAWYTLIDCVARLILSEHSEAMMYDVSHHYYSSRDTDQ
jgi:hypothetical protein